MTPEQLRHEVIKIASELARYQSDDRQSVYVKRSVVNGEACQFAVRLKQLADKFCPPGKK